MDMKATAFWRCDMDEMEYWEEYDIIHNNREKSPNVVRRLLMELLKDQERGKSKSRGI